MSWVKPLDSIVQVEREASCTAVGSILITTVDSTISLWGLWQPDRTITAVEDAKRDAIEAQLDRTGDEAAATSGRARGSMGAAADGEENELGNDGERVLSSTTQIVRCWPRPPPAPGQLDRTAPNAAAVAAAALRRLRLSESEGGGGVRDGVDSSRLSGRKDPLTFVPPFICCVRVDRLQLRGARGGEGAGAPRPLVLSIHAPLTLLNTLPVKVKWSISVLRSEMLEEAEYAAAANPFDADEPTDGHEYDESVREREGKSSLHLGLPSFSRRGTFKIGRSSPSSRSEEQHWTKKRCRPRRSHPRRSKPSRPLPLSVAPVSIPHPQPHPLHAGAPRSQAGTTAMTSTPMMATSPVGPPVPPRRCTPSMSASARRSVPILMMRRRSRSARVPSRRRLRPTCTRCRRRCAGSSSSRSRATRRRRRSCSTVGAASTRRSSSQRSA